jgi:signal transduction histidine kinase
VKSIRTRLLLWLLPGMGLLWGAAGVVLFQAVKRGLELQIDSDLRNLVGPARFIARAHSLGIPQQQFRGSDLAGFNDPDGRVYFAAWRSAEDTPVRSKSLGDRTLPRPKRFASQGVFRDYELANGEWVRTLSVRSQNPPPGRPVGPRGGGGPPGRDEFSRMEMREPGRGGPPPEDGRPRAWQLRPGREGGAEGGPGHESVDLVLAKSRRRIDETLQLVLGGIGFTGIVAALASMLLVRLALESGLRPLRNLGDQTAGIDTGALDHRFATDILPVELRPIGVRLNDLLARLQQGFERERRFGADLAHELRTPVAELRSMAEVAMKWPEQTTPENYQDLLAISERMQGTIENLLRLARLENRASVRRDETVRLSEFLLECWKPFSERAAGRGLRVRFSVPPEISLATDPNLLRTIASNLLSNAAEYAEADSEVTVESADSGPVVSVCNAAPHLSDDDIPHLFERLWRLDRSRTSGSHCGLGLALAKACAEALDMRLTAELKDGRLKISLTRLAQ